MAMRYTYQWLCERIVGDSQLGVIFADEDGIIRLWNAGAEAIFGYSASEAVGKSMDMIIPERHRARHWEGYTRVMQTGVTKYGHDVLAVPAIRKGGDRISIEFNVAVLRSPTGQVVGAAATIQEVTARWEREKALRGRLAVLEAKVDELEKTLVSKAAAADASQ